MLTYKRKYTKNYEQGKPVITVITVVFNGGLTLEKTLKSIVEQTYKNLEIVVIDGNSSDNTLDVIRKFQDSIDYWQSEPDNGIYDAMNKGIEIASGDWIHFMNCGDSFYSNETINEVFSNNNYSECNVLYGNTNKVFPFGSSVYIPEKVEKGCTHMPFNHQSCFVNSDLYKKYFFDTNYRICADFDFFCKLIDDKKIFKYVDVIIANFDCSEGISSTSILRCQQETIKISRKKFKLLRYVIFMIVYSIKKILKLFIPKNIKEKHTLNYLRKHDAGR